MVNPKNLMYWVDSWKNTNPGKVNGVHLFLIAIQKARRARDLWRKKPKNWIYKIGNTREIVYKEFERSPAVMKMGVSGHFLRHSGNPFHKFMVPMEKYAKYFIDNSDPEWLKRNDYELV